MEFQLNSSSRVEKRQSAGISLVPTREGLATESAKELGPEALLALW